MEFSYSEELLEIKRTVRDFAECEIRPHVLEWDEQQIFPRDVLQKLAGLGFMGVLIPPSMAAPDWAMSSTSRLSRNCRAWTAPSESLWRRTIRCVPAISTASATKNNGRNSFSLSPGARNLALGASPNPKREATPPEHRLWPSWMGMAGFATGKRP